MQHDRLWHFHRRRHQIIGKRAGQKAAVIGIGILFIERCTERLGKAAADLPRHHRRMQDAAAIVHRDIAVEADGAGRRIDLDAAEIENEAMAQRAIDLVGVGRRRELRRRPENRLADSLTKIGGKRARRPMAARGEARER